jgi:hypothetical protein
MQTVVGEQGPEMVSLPNNKIDGSPFDGPHIRLEGLRSSLDKPIRKPHYVDSGPVTLTPIPEDEQSLWERHGTWTKDFFDTSNFGEDGSELNDYEKGLRRIILIPLAIAFFFFVLALVW